MHTKQQVGIGALLAVTTAISWGVLPIAMKQVLPVMDPLTVVWYRFSIASLGLLLILGLRGRLPTRTLVRQPKTLLLLLVATLGLLGNFIFFSSSLQYLNPTTSQVIGQLAPIGMMLASVFILKERMRPAQVVGALMLITGLMLFFNVSLKEIFTRLTDYTFGVLLGICASTVWVCYGLAQKLLLRQLASTQILVILYILCAIALFPVARPGLIGQLSHWQIICLLFCGVNTLVGYGALAEAMARWQAAQVSALVTLTPLFTLLFSDLLALAWPDTFATPALNLVGYIGAFVVVAGAMFSAIGHRWWPHRAENRRLAALKQPGE